MAKPEVLHSIAFGRTERRITFEAKESPSLRSRNDVKHDGLLHLAAITGNPLKTKYGAM